MSIEYKFFSFIFLLFLNYLVIAFNFVRYTISKSQESLKNGNYQQITDTMIEMGFYIPTGLSVIFLIIMLCYLKPTPSKLNYCVLISFLSLIINTVPTILFWTALKNNF